jgi:hypothetical protein
MQKRALHSERRALHSEIRAFKISSYLFVARFRSAARFDNEAKASYENELVIENS